MQRWLLAGLILMLGMSWTGLWSVEILAKPEAAGPTAAATDLDIDGNLRLDRSVVPVHYSLDLTIDPTKDRFSGKVAIRVQLSRETSLIRLHGQGMNFAQTAIESEGKRLPVHVVQGKNGGIALIVDPPLAAGRATIHFSYDAPFSSGLAGLYRVEDRSQWYAFTQFEALDARRAFPGFDQPEFKTPYAVTMRVPEGIIALTNGPQQKRHTDGQSQVFTFAETKPLPTYLVAFAVGPFDVVAGPENASAKPPLRIITTRGKGKLAAFALKRTQPILQWLSDYFGQPYPFAKLDQVAVPNFGGGAMENVGLVTYREPLLLLDETQAPIWSRLWSQMVIAHELSHMWYGNLVTMPWWDDLWLNEAFATWMSFKVIADIDPELEAPLEAVARTQGVMDLDSKRDARAIRQPIRHGGDIRNAFDGITYGKGSAVLRMTEAWIGETAFRDGVRTYMRQHAYGSGATADLLAALDNVSGKPVAETVRLFLDQPGTPLVDVTLSCDQEPRQPAALLLKQRRYRVAGSDVPEGEAWTVPVCVRYGFADEGEMEPTGHRECFLLDDRQKTVTLSQPGCPVWLHPNADEQGYYRWSLQPEVLSSVVNQHRRELSLVERVALPGQLLALLRAGALSVAAYGDALGALAQEQHRKVIDQVATGLGYLHTIAVENERDDLAEPFAQYTKRLLAPHLKRIGIAPQENEPAAARLLRPSLVRSLADRGKDKALLNRAQEVRRQFLEPPSSVATETLAMFLPIAARYGDPTLWAQLMERVPQASSPAVRTILIRSLGSFEDPALVRRTLGGVLDGTLRTQDFGTLAGSIRRAARPAAWQWLTENYDQLVEKLGPWGASYLPRVATGFCSPERHAEVKTFFTEHEGVPEGTERKLNLALEDIERCVRQREAIREPLRKYLAASN